MVIKNNILPLHHLSGSHLTPNIVDFCGNYPIIKVAAFKDKSSLEQVALVKARGMFILIKLVEWKERSFSAT